MDLPWNDERSNQFITNVGLITTDGPFGPNVMACEWTHHISYQPGLIAVSLGNTKATVENIRISKEFGVNLCASDQSVLSSVAGGYTGSMYDKVSALKEMGFEFYKAQRINSLMIKGAVLNIECKLYKEITLGDHITFVGEVVEASNNPDKVPLAYHKGKYWIMNTNLAKPSMEERQSIKKIVEKYSKDDTRR
ncbi:MAG TPA: flavin reductase family protein [Nitrososphaeraceae archaeon]|nr:flavin reductase family protein [Nitrososphaeraceae archaeon]